MDDKTDRKLLKLPIGIQTFERLRAEGCVYVDKTKYLIDLIDNGTVYFLSRPRRFGKSLTISTFDALFSGKRELFKGLSADEYFERPDYRPYPVVHIDMSRTMTDQGADELRKSILLQVLESARLNGVVISELAQSSPGTAFAELLRLAGEKLGPVVVLIDEYDKPILDVLKNSALAEEHRSALRNFYAQIKAADAYIKFVFITGITKFTRAGVFSVMNNLNDISMDDRYATMFGYTSDELLVYFREHIEETAKHLKVSPETLIGDMQDYYDGFSFDGVNRLYNPFSTLLFFDRRRFENFWFESGSPSYLVEYVKTHDIETEDFRGRIESSGFTSVAEIELASPSSFLFQSGYLTIREMDGAKLILDYPNKEVLSSMANLFMYSRYGNQSSDAIRFDLEKAIANDDAEAVVMFYKRTLAAIPHGIHAKEGRKYKLNSDKGELSMSNLAESFYHAVLFTMLWASGVTTVAENHSYKGRSDVEVIHKGKYYVIELKIADGPEASKIAAEHAIAQIQAKGYAEKYPKARLIGIAVDRLARQVGASKII